MKPLRVLNFNPGYISLDPRALRCGPGNVDLYTATRHYLGWYA